MHYLHEACLPRARCVDRGDNGGTLRTDWNITGLVGAVRYLGLMTGLAGAVRDRTVNILVVLNSSSMIQL